MPELPGEIPSGNRIRLSCSSADYCVAPVLVDSPDIPGYRWVVVERWDGEQWSAQSTANPAPTWPGSSIQEVSCARGPQARCTLVPTGAYQAEPLIAQRLRSSPVALEPSGGFPASFALAGEAKVILRGQTTIKCTTQGEVPALEGGGQFEDSVSGTATLKLHNCTEAFNTACTTPGESEGTIVAAGLPIELAYLSDGEPGLVFLPSPETEQVAKAKCLGGFITVDVAGSGVLGRITDPAVGEASETLAIDLDAPEVGEGEYVQEYTETEAGLEYGLQMTVNGGKAKPAALEAESVASFDDGGVELTEE